MDFKEKAQVFALGLLGELNSSGFTLPQNWDVDHICYRVENQTEYEATKNVLMNQSDLLAETLVNGRLISTFELHEPITCFDFQIKLVELPAPKPGRFYSSGFDHIEIVAPENFTKIIKFFSSFQIDEESLTKSFNPELKLNLRSGQIKFHHLSLSSVIALELNEKAFEALKKSKALEILKPYSPELVGTFPLGLAKAGSDLDILIQSADFEDLSVCLGCAFSIFRNYHQQILDVNGAPSMLVGFEVDGVPFEIFAQNRDPVTQAAYLHFNIEERLLKIGGQSIRKKLSKLRQQGLKTEEAFAQILGLKGDPFLNVLELNLLSRKEILELVKNRL